MIGQWSADGERVSGTIEGKPVVECGSSGACALTGLPLIFAEGDFMSTAETGKDFRFLT
jgi:hypothetical protein